MRIAVVGGGVIGLSAAYVLAQRGVDVALFERGRCGEGASRVAAGMLAPLSESPFPGPLARIGLDALAGFEHRLGAIEESSGISCDLVRCGTVLLLPATEHDALRKRLEWQRAADATATLLDSLQVRALVPGLGDRFVGGHYPREMQLDAWRYTQALRRAAESAGARVMEGTSIHRLSVSSSKVQLEAVEGPLDFDHVVVAPGADSALLRSSGFALPLRAVKGEAVRLRTRRVATQSILFAPDCYVTPKADGTVLIGATQVPDRYETDVQAASISGLLRVAISLLPELSDGTFVEATAGLRPAFPDRLPVVGPLDEHGRLWFLGGHFRNGILLSGWTAEALARSLCEGLPPPADFAPRRLSTY